MTKKKGFTLIELLVVIAIIGILAAIVLVSLTGARNKAKDARIQADISQIRTVAELAWDDYGAYNAAGSTLCADTPGYTTLAADINDQKAQTVVCIDDADEYCVSAFLTDGTTFICVGEAGKVGAVNCGTNVDACD